MGVGGRKVPYLFMMNKYSFWLAFVLFALSPSCYSQDVIYFYTGSGSEVLGQRFASASSACEMSAAKYGESLGMKDPQVKSVTLNPSNSNSYMCVFTKVSAQGGAPFEVNREISRFGNSCEEGGVFSAEKGEFNSPCKDKFGQEEYISTHTPKYEFCYMRCVVAATATTGEINPFKKDVDEKVLYGYTVVYTGESCGADETAYEDTPPEPTSSNSEKDCSPTTTNADGSKSSTCVSKERNIDNSGCAASGGSQGTINGVQSCVIAKKVPKATEKKETTKETTKTNPDGSKEVVTEKKTENKVCSGTQSCSTNTTTNITTVKTNADGTPGKTTSECKGDKCSADTGSGGSGGSGKGEGEGEEEGIPAPSKTLGQGEKGDFTAANTEWDTKIETAKEELSSKIEEYKSLFAGVFDLNLNSGGGSLMCETIPITFGRFGSGSARICPRDYADQLSYLRYALLLAAGVISAMIILRD